LCSLALCAATVPPSLGAGCGDDGRPVSLNGLEHAAVAARRLGIRLVGLAVVAALLAALGGAVYAGVSLLMSAAAPPVRCSPNQGGVPIEAAGTTSVTNEQLANATVIVATGREMGVPDRGLWVALATALQESTLRNLDYGDRDSLGLFQQRPSQGWGSPAQVRDPRYAATQFYDRLVDVAGWEQMPLWQAAQTVQRSAFPLAYARWEQEAADILAEVDAVGGVRFAAASGPCVPVEVARQPGGGGSGCTEDDPTTNGCVTPTTLRAVTLAASTFGGLRKGPIIRSAGCHAQRPANPTSDHPLGKGCDFFPGEGGRFARGVEIVNGWRAAESFRRGAEGLGVDYIIWQGRIWSPGSPDQGVGAAGTPVVGCTTRTTRSAGTTTTSTSPSHDESWDSSPRPVVRSASTGGTCCAGASRAIPREPW
jgi:hypothetical protein